MQILGYTSLWDELTDVFRDGADVIVPVGAGGLLAAGVLYRIEKRAAYHLIGVEPDTCATLRVALTESKPVPLSTRSYFAPGLNVDVAPCEVLEIVTRADCLDLLQVADHEMAAASSIMAKMGMSVDPAASAAVACALFRAIRRLYRDLVVIVTARGATVTAERLREQGLLTLCDRDLSNLCPGKHVTDAFLSNV